MGRFIDLTYHIMTTRTDFESRFAETGRNIDEMVADTREEYREERNALKTKWSDMQKEWDAVEDKSDSTWDTIKDKWEEGLRDIEDTYKDMKHNFSSEDHTGHNH